MHPFWALLTDYPDPDPDPYHIPKKGKRGVTKGRMKHVSRFHQNTAYTANDNS